MGKVISIERQRTLRLALEIEREFRRSGARELRVKAGDVDDVGRWRRAAVIAVHRLGHPATTWASGEIVAAAVLRPVTVMERQDAAQRIADLLFGGTPPS